MLKQKFLSYNIYSENIVNRGKSRAACSELLRKALMFYHNYGNMVFLQCFPVFHAIIFFVYEYRVFQLKFIWKTAEIDRHWQLFWAFQLWIKAQNEKKSPKTFRMKVRHKSLKFKP